MKAPNKMMIAVGALALTATTLLAGCGGSSSASTAASEPAAAEAPASIFEGLVQPVGVPDEGWTAWQGSVADLEDVVSAAESPEFLGKVCDEGLVSDKLGELAEKAAAIDGTSVKEWTQVLTTLYENIRLQACSLAG